MKSNHELLKRAFEIADSGEVNGVVELRRRLASEGFGQWQLDQLGGRAILKQLRGKMRAARVKK